MQLRIHPRNRKTLFTRSLIIKVILIIFVFMFAIFLLDKIEMRVPNKLIKQEISNDKLITIK